MQWPWVPGSRSPHRAGAALWFAVSFLSADAMKFLLGGQGRHKYPVSFQLWQLKFNQHENLACKNNFWSVFMEYLSQNPRNAWLYKQSMQNKKIIRLVFCLSGCLFFVEKMFFQLWRIHEIVRWRMHGNIDRKWTDLEYFCILWLYAHQILTRKSLVSR